MMRADARYLTELYKRFGYVTAEMSDADFPAFLDMEKDYCGRLHENLDYLFELGLGYTNGLPGPAHQPKNEYGLNPVFIDVGNHVTAHHKCLRGKYHHERLFDFQRQFEQGPARPACLRLPGMPWCNAFGDIPRQTVVLYIVDILQ